MHVQIHDGHAFNTKVFKRMASANGQVVEHAIPRSERPMSVMRASRHVARNPAVAQRMLRRFNRTAHQNERALYHGRRPWGQTDAFLFLVGEVTGQKAVHKIRIMGQQQQLTIDGFRAMDNHALVRIGGLQSTEQELVAISGKARLRMNAVGVEGVVPETKIGRKACPVIAGHRRGFHGCATVGPRMKTRGT